MTKQDRVRVLRVLEYEGPRSWVEETLAERSVKGCKSVIVMGDSPVVIREAIIGEMPAILDAHESDTNAVVSHNSDCAVHSAPAERRLSGLCDCGLDPEPTPGETIEKPKCMHPTCKWPLCVVGKDTGLHLGRRCAYGGSS